MKKLLSLVAFIASVTFITGCTEFESPTPLDTKPGESNRIGNPDGISDSSFGGSDAGLDQRNSNKFDPSRLAYTTDLDHPDARDVIASIYFDFDQYAVASGERSKLASAAQELAANESTNILVVGHTDYYGTEEYNVGLSDKRASAVLAYLGNLNISKDRGEVVPRGKNGATPGVAKNSPEAKKERRVDILRLK